LTILESIILGLVQGLAEFLPVSSSGHLAILQYFFGIEGESVLIFAVMLHFGTLLSLIAVYYRDIWDLILELGAMFKDVATGRGFRISANPTRKIGVMIVLASIPTGIIGITMKDYFEKLYTSMPAVAISLIITGTMLWIAEVMTSRGHGIKNARFRSALVVGLFQSVAICPGISRSGATIVGGLFSGFNRELAVRFAFLISIPPILGAVILEMPEALSAESVSIGIVPMVVGVTIAALSGFVAIKTMIKVVTGRGLKMFSYYTWSVGAILLVYMIIKAII
jgi:undecaprenyl-diphosphatase